MNIKLAIVLLASSAAYTNGQGGQESFPVIDRRASVLVGKILAQTSQLPTAERRKAVSIGLNRWFKPLTIHVPDALSNLIPSSSNLIKVIEDPKNSGNAAKSVESSSTSAAKASAPANGQPAAAQPFMNYDPMQLMNFDPNPFIKAMASNPSVAFDSAFQPQNSTFGFDDASASSAMFQHFPPGMMGDEGAKQNFGTANIYDDDSRGMRSGGGGKFHYNGGPDDYGMGGGRGKYGSQMDDSEGPRSQGHFHAGNGPRQEGGHFHRPSSGYFGGNEGGYGTRGNMPTHLVSGSGNYDYQSVGQASGGMSGGMGAGMSGAMGGGMGGGMGGMSQMDDSRMAGEQRENNYGDASQAAVVHSYQSQAQAIPQQQEKQVQYQSVPMQYESEVAAQRLPQQYQAQAQPVQQQQQYQSLAPSIAVSGLKDSSDIDIGPGAHGQYFREYQVSSSMMQAPSAYANDSSRFVNLEHSPESFFKNGAISTSAVGGDDNMKEYSDTAKSQYGGYYNGFQGSASVLAPVVVKTDGSEVVTEEETQGGNSQKSGFSEPETSSGGFVPMLTQANVYPRAHAKANSPRPVTTRIKAFIKNMLVQKN